MNNKPGIAIKNQSIASKIASWTFGLIAFAIGIVNTFYGKDAFFGIFIILLSFVYFLPVNTILRKMTNFSIPWIGVVRIVLGILILLAALGVGELFDKIDMMRSQ